MLKEQPNVHYPSNKSRISSPCKAPYPHLNNKNIIFLETIIIPLKE